MCNAKSSIGEVSVERALRRISAHAEKLRLVQFIIAMAPTKRAYTRLASATQLNPAIDTHMAPPPQIRRQLSLDFSAREKHRYNCRIE